MYIILVLQLVVTIPIQSPPTRVRTVERLHEPDPALDQAAGQMQLRAKAALVAFFVSSAPYIFKICAGSVEKIR